MFVSRLYILFQHVCLDCGDPYFQPSLIRFDSFLKFSGWSVYLIAERRRVPDPLANAKPKGKKFERKRACEWTCGWEKQWGERKWEREREESCYIIGGGWIILSRDRCSTGTLKIDEAGTNRDCRDSKKQLQLTVGLTNETNNAKKRKKMKKYLYT